MLSKGKLEKHIKKIADEWVLENKRPQFERDIMRSVNEAKKDLYENSYRETEDEIKIDYKTWIKWFGGST